MVSQQNKFVYLNLKKSFFCFAFCTICSVPPQKLFLSTKNWHNFEADLNCLLQNNFFLSFLIKLEGKLFSLFGKKTNGFKVELNCLIKKKFFFAQFKKKSFTFGKKSWRSLKLVKRVFLTEQIECYRHENTRIQCFANY